MSGEYKLLTAHFFKGTQKGQIVSLWKKKEILERIEEYKRALAAGHCKLVEKLNKSQFKKLIAMGIEVPEEIKPIKKEKPPKPEKVKRNPNDVRLTNKQVKRLESLGVTIPEEMLPLRVRKTEAAAATAVVETSTTSA